MVIIYNILYQIKKIESAHGSKESFIMEIGEEANVNSQDEEDLIDLNEDIKDVTLSKRIKR